MRVKLLAKDGSEWIEGAEILEDKVRFDYSGSAMLLVGFQIEIDGNWVDKPITIHDDYIKPFTVSNEHPFAIVAGYTFHFDKWELV